MLDAQLLAPLTTRPLRREEYDRLVALGVFDDERIELLEGVIVTMSPNNPEHASPVQLLNELLLPALLGRAVVRIQLPLNAVRESEPEPDVVIAPLGDYRRAHPDRAHCVIEVANSSVGKDRNVKAPLYAASGFHEYWLVNVPEQVVEVFREPSPEGYRQATRHGISETISLQDFPDVQLEIAKLF
ncbi:MAG TPA: Uma2 family endonuclease [Polyangiaceae bacterium]|nr:Uma2 family endonuclease [Polyangiaceae bacterium]